MQIEILKSKIHRATVTEMDLNYSGSLGIDRTLMKLSGIAENEKVLIAKMAEDWRPMLSRSQLTQEESASTVPPVDSAEWVILWL